MYTVNETLLVPSTKKSAIVEFSMSGDTPSVLRSFGKPEETPESSAVTSIGTLLYVACANGISIYASSRTFLTSVSADDALIRIASSYSQDKIIAASTQSLFIYARDGSGSLSLASSPKFHDRKPDVVIDHHDFSRKRKRLERQQLRYWASQTVLPITKL